jgi:hypothetical protein
MDEDLKGISLPTPALRLLLKYCETEKLDPIVEWHNENLRPHSLLLLEIDLQKVLKKRLHIYHSSRSLA